MITLGSRRYGHPILIRSGNKPVRLTRIHFFDKGYDEKWLQDLIRKNPDLLPVGEIDQIFTPLIPIGEEVQTKAGSIDNLFLSPHGYLTLVETKLWRNPKARREVVGQVIDYAKEISRWSYEKLEEQVRNYNQKFGGFNFGIFDTVRTREVIEKEDEPIIVDTITRNLQKGRFLLMVVGDGIRENVEEMVDYLNQTPQLHFTLKLVELQVYEVEVDQEKLTLIIPHIIVRTREVTRAILQIEGKAEVSIPPPSDEDFFGALGKKAGTESARFAQRIINDMENLGCKVVWKQSSYVVKFPDPSGGGDLLTLFVVDANGWVYTYSGWLKSQLHRIFALPETEEIAIEFLKKFAELPQSPSRVEKNKGKLIPGSAGDLGVSLDEVHKSYDQLITTVKSTIDRIRELAEK